MQRNTLTELGYLAGASRFKRISEKLQIDGDKIYKEAKINFKASWFSVYYIILTSERPVTITEISNHIKFSHITVKNVIRELKKENIVIIFQNPNDKRSKQVKLSKKGIALQNKLKPVWNSFSDALKATFNSGHPDILNILDRIETESTKHPIHVKVQENTYDNVQIVDYKPSLKKYFYRLAAPWLLDVMNGELEKEDEYTLNNPEEAYIKQGGFLFYAKYRESIVGCVVLKRLDDDIFEFAKLFVNPNYRGLGIATKLIERCITRCKENEATALWLQTTRLMKPAHKLYYKLGFNDSDAPKQMSVLNRTEKIMCLTL